MPLEQPSPTDTSPAPTPVTAPARLGGVPAHLTPPTTTAQVVAQVEQIRLQWAEQTTFTPATLDKCGQTIARFARRLAAQGITDLADVQANHCAGFVNARTPRSEPPELTTQHHRRSALRMLFRSARDLGLVEGDPTLDLALPPRTATGARPLSDEELALCRVSARMGEAGASSLHRALCWALGEATAVTSEISAVRICDLDDPDAPRWVRLPGTRRHDPRLGELSDWGSVIVSRWLIALPASQRKPSRLLAYRGRREPGEAAAQSAVCNAVGAVLDLAGLGPQPDIRPASLRNWAGRSLYDAGLPLEQVARRLGARSLDTAAADIGLNWRSAS